MTSYFDDLRTEVRNISTVSQNDAEFLLSLEEIEHGVIRDVNYITGDREFPEDLREKIQGLIAVHRTQVMRDEPPTRARELNLRMRRSQLLQELHSAFHEVGFRRIKTRFGVLSDNPRVNCLMRESYENPLEED